MSGSLDGVARAMRNRAAAREGLSAAVRAARGQGFTWTQIAKVFGVSRQAVTRRFGERS